MGCTHTHLSAHSDTLYIAPMQLHLSPLGALRGQALVLVPRQRCRGSLHRPTTVAGSQNPHLKQAVVGFVSVAALSGLAVLVSQRIAPPPRRRDQKRAADEEASSSYDADTAGASEGVSLGFAPDRSQWSLFGWRQRPRDLEREVALIDVRREREAKTALQRWDRRWTLRKKTLPELKNMAA